VFADAATGAHSPSLVSQEDRRGDRRKPAERRMMLEEAAGSQTCMSAGATPRAAQTDRSHLAHAQT
jgi:hypothetical protein